ncbi:hypothetical protein HAX54_052266 [Datura stramonium]|uniref:Uncharacterized protein n=1 Tax=Datura stramonium TaxID=4076 RepID=A0ABS8T0Y6_DATST|nr:hypothetical protein [Datura stramonium]
MGSYQLLSDQQVQNCFASSSSSSSFCTETQRGCSKAQNCLHKILRIISTVPPENIKITSVPPSLSSQKLNGCNRFAIDLNIGFNVPPETEESGSPLNGGWVSGQSTCIAACGNFADEKSTVAAECGGVSTVDFGKCSDDGEEKSCKSDSSGVQSTKKQEIIEIMQLENSGVSESKEEIGELKEQQQGFMGLLIEAATLIFGDFKDENPKSECETEMTKSFKSEKFKIEEEDDGDNVAATKKQLKRRNSEVTEEAIEDKSSYPLVRSKRGRIQVLPNKYRDSILEPLTPFSRIRSTILPNRRRSK